jgi:hypothetical protein
LMVSVQQIIHKVGYTRNDSALLFMLHLQQKFGKVHLLPLPLVCLCACNSCKFVGWIIMKFVHVPQCWMKLDNRIGRFT